MSNLSIVGFHVIGPVGNQIDALEAENTELRRELDDERSKRRELGARPAKIDHETSET